MKAKLSYFQYLSQWVEYPRPLFEVILKVNIHSGSWVTLMPTLVQQYRSAAEWWVRSLVQWRTFCPSNAVSRTFKDKWQDQKMVTYQSLKSIIEFFICSAENSDWIGLSETVKIFSIMSLTFLQVSFSLLIAKSFKNCEFRSLGMV